MKLSYFPLLCLMLVTAFTSCVKDEMYNGPASISDLAFAPATTVTPDDIVTVTVTLTALKGIQAASIFYKVNTGSFMAVVMNAGTNNVYKGSIPRQADKAEVTFYIEAVTVGGIKNQSAEKTYKVGAIAPNYAAIMINEVDGNKKFVELYNSSDKPVNISGMAIIKNGVSLKNEDGSPAWVVPAGVIIPAKGFGVIKCSGYAATADAASVIIGTVSDGMSAKQTLLLELIKPDGTVLNTFQRGVAPWSVTISAVAATDSYSRIPDGTGAWKTALSTAGKTNGASTGDIPAL